MKRIILLLGIGLNILSCNTTKEDLPTEQMAKENVTEIIKVESENKVELVSLEKTDALKEKVFEIDAYTIEFEGKVKFNQNGFSQIHEPYKLKKGFLLVLDEEPKPSLQYYYVPVKKDEIKKIKGKIMFLKKENGWKKDMVRIYLEDKK